MTVIKNFVDVLEVAVRIERQGIQFYKKLSLNAKSPQTSDIFSFLAAEEEKHSGTFANMLEKLADYTPRYDYPGEYGLFLNYIASDILKRIEKANSFQDAANTDEALDYAIEFEKETILFYLELDSEKEFSEENRIILGDIVNEEIKHWKKLVSMKLNSFPAL